MIYVISGKKRTGKNTVANFLSEIKGCDVTQYAFADTLKAILAYSSRVISYEDYRANVVFLMLRNLNEWYDGQRDLDLNITDDEAILLLKLSVDYLYDYYIPKDGVKIPYDDIIVKNEPWTMRRLMQVFGTDIVCNYIGKTVWVNITIGEICKDCLNFEMSDVIITDCRQKHEEEILRLLGAKFIFVNKDTGSDDNHITEKGLIPRPEDIVIDNNGSLENLENKLKEIFT